jgi:hypothetical protein
LFFIYVLHLLVPKADKKGGSLPPTAHFVAPNPPLLGVSPPSPGFAELTLIKNFSFAAAHYSRVNKRRRGFYRSLSDFL